MRPERAKFYEAVTADLFRGSLPDWQREPLDRIIDEGEARGRRLVECAYVLATAYWETGRFRHMEEIGQGEGKAYGEELALMGSGSRITKRARYHGRGFVQLTWLANYARMALLTGVDLVNAPERAAEPEIAAKVLWEGMIRGTFTGKNLADYFGEDRADYVEARRIVNGTDRAEEIAGFARQFDLALRLIGEAPPVASACPLGRGDCPRAA